MVKDPKTPKRALSAYFFFCNEKRAEVKKENPDFKLGQISKKLAEMWGELTDEDKKPYNEMHDKDIQRYEEEKKVYNSSAKSKKDSDDEDKESE